MFSFLDSSTKSTMDIFGCIIKVILDERKPQTKYEQKRASDKCVFTQKFSVKIKSKRHNLASAFFLFLYFYSKPNKDVDGHF